MFRIATLKLTDVARTFYDGTLELHDQSITWTTFKAAFNDRFRDVRTDQYHFTQFQMARQKKDEFPQDFADRCRSLAQKTVPRVEDPATQRIYYDQAERMLLASFTPGLLNIAGRQVRYAMPKTMDEALKIAITVNQAEIQERSNEAFYENEARGSGTADRAARGTRYTGTVRNTTQHAGISRTQGQNSKGLYRSAGNGNERKCYECVGAGHLGRECPIRQNRMNPRNASSNRSGNAAQTSAGSYTQETSRRSKEKNNSVAGRRAGNRSRDSSFQITVPENDTDYFAVRMKLTAGAPTIQATISGLHRTFIVDTGSSISLIQPGVCSNEVRPTNLSPFGVTGNELQITGAQEVELHLNGKKFRHQFRVCSLPTKADGIVGMDFLLERNADLNLGDQELRLGKDSNIVQGYVGEETRQVGGRADRLALTLFVTQDDRHSREERPQNVRSGEGTREQQENQRPYETDLQEAGLWMVTTTETVRLVPRVKQIVVGKAELPKRLSSPELMCVEPSQLPLEGVLVASGLSRAFNKATERPRQRETTTPLTSRADQLSSTPPSVYVHVMVINYSHEKKLPKAAVLGLAEETSARIVAAINDEELLSVRQNGKTPPRVSTPGKDTWFKEYLRDRLGHLNREERAILEPVMAKYRHVFHSEGSNEFQGTDLVEHKIITGDARPIRKSP